MRKSRLAAYVICVIAGAFGIYSAVKHFSSGSIAGHTIPAHEQPSALVRSLRPNYPYSVIAGGAYSSSELSYAQAKDPVVRNHYSDFNAKDARLVQLTDDRYQYASYRKKNKVFWTKKKLRIPKGELLWTDGKSYARARCGNRLSDKPKEPTNAKEPSEALLSLPPVRPDMLPQLSLVETPELADVPATDVLPVETGRLGAQPLPVPITPSAGQTWGPGPIAYPVAPIAVAPGGVAVPGGGTGGSTGSSSGNPVATTPPATTPPVTPVTPIPPPVTPVPEPASALYMFFLALAVSAWGIWRLVPKAASKAHDSNPGK